METKLTTIKEKFEITDQTNIEQIKTYKQQLINATDTIASTLIVGENGIGFCGKITGCGDKPSLFKTGAIYIAQILNCYFDFEIIDKDIQPNMRREMPKKVYNYQTKQYSESVEVSVGYWRFEVKAILRDNNTKEIKWVGVGSCSNIGKFAKMDDNTILKMAKKRAMVDCALQVGTLSNYFTQDLEDMGK